MLKEDVVMGMPSACLLPAAKYGLREVVGMTSLTVPVRGDFPEGSGSEGSFDICPEPGVILTGAISTVLFAFGKYPDLKESQRFVIAGLSINEDNIEVVGKVVEFVDNC